MCITGHGFWATLLQQTKTDPYGKKAARFWTFLEWPENGRTYDQGSVWNSLYKRWFSLRRPAFFNPYETERGSNVFLWGRLTGQSLVPLKVSCARSCNFHEELRFQAAKTLPETNRSNSHFAPENMSQKKCVQMLHVWNVSLSTAKQPKQLHDHLEM